MALTPTEQRLLDALTVLPVNNVYAAAAKREILRGFKLYVERQVTRLHWEGDGVLVADLGSPEWYGEQRIRHSVRLFLDGGDLRFECSCSGARESDRCSHMVGALIGVLHVMNPKLFRMTREDAAYRTSLEEGLLKAPASSRGAFEGAGADKVIEFRGASWNVGRAPVRLQIIIELSAGALRASVESKGRRLDDYSDLVGLPWEVAHLLRGSYSRDMSSALATFLRRVDNAYPLFFQEGPDRHRIEWFGERAFPTWTELHARGDQIVLRKGFSLGVGGLQTDRLVGSFAFDGGWTQMCYIAAREGWQPWEYLTRLDKMSDSGVSMAPAGSDGRETSLPVSRFRMLPLALKKSRVKEMLGPIRCFEDGQEVSIGQAETTGYRLRISRSATEERTFLIEPECWSGDYFFSPSQRILSFVRDIEWGRAPASIRTKRRKPLLYEALFEALSRGVRKGLGEWLRERINEYTFGRRTSSAEARRSIKDAIEKFRDEELQFHFSNIGWRLISVNKEKEKLLFLVPYKVFGAALFDRLVLQGSAMMVREEDLFDRLHLLHNAAMEAGIELVFDQFPVRSVTWELELDASSGAIDWFEVHPEIRCNGQTIPREVWEQALSRKGIIFGDGVIQIVDRKSLEALHSLNRLWSSTAKTAPGHRNVVSIPRLRIIDLLLLRKQGVTVRLSAGDEAILQRLTRFVAIEERALPDRLSGNLRQYQKEGYEWLAFLYEHGFGACLADDMGLGKTLQAICLLAGIKEGKVRNSKAKTPNSGRHLPVLIVVPPSLIFNWEQEIDKFYPDLRVYVYRGKERSIGVTGYDVMLTSYGLARKDVEKLKDVTFDIIVFDEAQAVKNIFAGTTGAVRQLRGRFKIALTGTPVENHVGEYFSIMDLVLPGLLGEYREFQGRARADLAALLPEVLERTRPFVLRRTKDRILQELPPKIERDIYLELTEQQKRFYNRTVQEVRSTIDAAYRAKIGSQARIIALTAIMKLRQICLTPQLLVADMKETAPKVEFLKEKLEELLSEGHSALVFSQFTSFLDVVEVELGDSVSLVRLDGSTPVPERKRIVHAFQESIEPSVFLLSLKAGGQGLNLTKATYVFHLDPWWNPAVENQASDRSHRIGQVNKVMVIRLLMRHTVEEKMMALKNRKMGLYRALMEAPEKSGSRSITKEDFDFLLS